MDYRFRPLDGLISFNKKDIDSDDLVASFSCAQEEINSQPAGRVTELALLFYFIYLMKEKGLSFIVKGGIIGNYYLKEHVRVTHDADIIITGDIEKFYVEIQELISNYNGPFEFIINYYEHKLPDNNYYYETFNIQIEVKYQNEHYGQIIIDGITNSVFDEKDKINYPGPSIISEGFRFEGVPIEYVMAEKVIAITNELVRPYKHLIDLYGLMKADINYSLLKKYLKLINDNDNKYRKEKRDLILEIREDKKFLGNYLLTCLQAGYQITLEEMKKEINDWLKSI